MSLLHEDKPSPKIAFPGILMPLLSHRFQVRYFGSSITPDQGKALTSQTVNFKMNFKTKTVSFEIEQPAVFGDLIEVVETLVRAPGTITVEVMDGGDQVLSRFEFGSLECISHAFDLDYADGCKPVRHQLVMKYIHMRSV